MPMPDSSTAPSVDHANKTQMFQMQHQIRANASELQEYFADLYKWEKSINQQEECRKNSGSNANVNAPPPVRQQVHMPSNPNKAPGEHVYDKGYAKWEQFDVDAALKEVDQDHPRSQQPSAPPTTPSAAPNSDQKRPKDTRSREEIEREEGNGHYKRGDYVAAIKCYTKCLGCNARNAIVLSNRAMAYLKNREYKKAEEDCTLALSIDPNHVKSLCRRATARNALGKHRLALLDVYKAQQLDPKSRQIDSQLIATQESIKTCLKRAPKRIDVPIQIIPSETKSTSDTSNCHVDKIQQNKTKLPASPSPSHQHEDQENMPGNQPNSEESAANTSQKKNIIKTSATQSTSRGQVPLPRLPKNPPTTSYELNRVWRTIKTNRKDQVKNVELLGLQSKYLESLPPNSLASIFKNSIEAELLCDFFHVFRHETLVKNPGFVAEFLVQLTKVPRFDMVFMFLSAEDKQDVAWVLDQLLTSDSLPVHVTVKDLEDLKKKYEL